MVEWSSVPRWLGNILCGPGGRRFEFWLFLKRTKENKGAMLNNIFLDEKEEVPALLDKKKREKESEH